MDQLKIEIERIIHPIIADEKFKNRFRQELYAHLVSLYEIEQSKHTDEHIALESALQQQGNPEVLRSDFLNSFSLPERWLARFDNACEPKPDKPILHHATRMAALVFCSIFLLQLIPFCLALIVKRKSSIMYFLTSLGIAGCIYAASMVFLAFLFLPRMRSVLKDTSHPVLRYLKLFQFAFVQTLLTYIAVGIAILLGHILLSSILGKQHVKVITLDYVCALWMGVYTPIVTLLICPYMLIREAQNNKPLPDWPYLSLNK